MITISSLEGVSSYQDESISYSYDIMQNEMTNAELVTFLETYDFQLDEDEAPTYNCGEYTEYYNTGTDGGSIYGCMDDGALNYNPSATYDGGLYCIYESDIGCTDYGAYNTDEGTQYNDCSCYGANFHTETIGFGGCDDWGELCNFFDNCYSTYLGGASYSITIDGDSFTIGSNDALVYEGCTDSEALNYAESIVDILTTGPFQQMSDNCVQFENNNCVYECDESYLDIDDGEGEDDYGSINIEDFSTQAISFEGSSFVIESGLGTQPAIFNYENCVDGAVVGLLVDHYGLRIPTGGEWTKAAREDNTRCWPWLESDCDAAAESYCNSIFTCMSDEEFEACEETVNDLMWDCQDDCMDSGSGCDGMLNQFNCEEIEGCTWVDNGFMEQYCTETCDQCMIDNYEICDGNPCV
jgi:hypothetical protein